VIRYSASTVPILELGLSGAGLSEQQLNDFGTFFIRPQLATVPGAAVPLPFGGKVRQIMVDIDSSQLKQEGLSPLDVVNAVNAQNVVLPTGTAKIGKIEYNIGLNGQPVTAQELNSLPVKTINGGTIFIRDVAHVRDGFAVQTNIVRQDGQRGALLTVEKSGDASTLAVVAGIRLPITVPPLLVPSEAVLYQAAGPQVAVVAQSNQVELRKVSLGRDFGNTIEIIGGVNEHDSIVASPPDYLVDGMKVSVQPPSGEAKT
jgi:hypothetical protein